MGTAFIHPTAAPVLVRAHQCQSDAQRTSPLTVQTARKMGAMRTSGIVDLLETYKKTQQSTLEGQRNSKEAQKEQQQPRDEPDVPQAARGSAPRPVTLEQRQQQDADEKRAEKELGVDRFRVRQRTCPNPECQDPSAQPEVDADGNSTCPSCGFVDENAAPEFEGAGQQDISDLEGGNRRTFLQDGGADNRTGQEWQDDANRDLYVIEARDVPRATDAQRWWANNRMNQSMVWADYMATDRGLPGGFAITHDEVRRIKDVLRAACIIVAPYAPSNDAGNEADDGGRFGSPLVWAVLLALEMIAQRPEGFMVATEAMQSTATLRALHLYMRKFQGRQEKRYVEMLNAFRTRAKGVEAQFAQQNLDRVKTRFAAWHALGSDPAKVAGKVATFDKILRKSNVFGPDVGLSAPVIAGEPPGLLAARPNQILNVKDLALNKGTYNPGGGKGMVDRAKEQSKGLNYFKEKEWDRADKLLLKRDPKARKSALEQEQEQEQEGMPGAEDSERSDSDDDEFSGLKLSKQERRIMRQQKKNEAQPQWSPAGPRPQRPTQDLSRLVDAPSDPMDVDPAPSLPAGAGGDDGGGGASSSSSSGTTSDAPDAQLPPRRTSLDVFSINPFAVHDDNTDGVGDDVTHADSDAGPEAARNGDVVADSEGVVTELPGTDEDDDRVADRALRILSLDLSDEGFAEQQQLQLEQMQQEDKERREERALREAEEAEARVAAQEAVEAPYRQDGVYDRSKDPRNNEELAENIPTPSYSELIRGGRRIRPEYKGVRVIRALTYDEVRESANFHRKGFEFVREWQEHVREWRAEQKEKLERLKNAEEIKEQSRQKRLDDAAARRDRRAKEETRLEEGRRKAEANRATRSDKKMARDQHLANGRYNVNVRDSSSTHLVIRKAENSNLLVPIGQRKRKPADGGEAQEGSANQVAEEDKEYKYDCAKCRLTRVIKGTKPRDGWECADGGYACKRRYNCKHCPRTFFKEGDPSDPSDKYECKDFGKTCMPSKKKQKK